MAQEESMQDKLNRILQQAGPSTYNGPKVASTGNPECVYIARRLTCDGNFASWIGVYRTIELAKGELAKSKNFDDDDNQPHYDNQHLIAFNIGTTDDTVANAVIKALMKIQNGNSPDFQESTITDCMGY